MPDDLDYNSDLAIEEGALDVEWLDHSNRMFKYCRIQADAHRALDQAKNAMAATKAQLERDIRTDPDAYGVVAGARGITEGAIAAAVLTHDDYSAANQAVIEAQYQYEIVQGAVKSFEHRKAALEGLVRLHGQQYFAGPAVPRNLSQERAERDARAQTHVRMRRGGRHA